MILINNNQKSLFKELSDNPKFYKIQKAMMEEEFYFLQDKCYDFIKPIEFIENSENFMGFVAGDFLETKKTIEPMITKETYKDIKHLPNYTYFIDLFYLLPEYRDKGIFCKHLKRMIDIYGLYNIILHLPNKFVIYSLLKNGLARRMNHNIVVSKLWLSFEDEETDEIIFSHYYDLYYCAVMDFSEKRRMSPVLDVDNECFNANDNRRGFKRCL